MKLYPSLSVLVSVTLNLTENGRTSFSDAGSLPLSASPARNTTEPSSIKLQNKMFVKHFDFYKDSHVEEVERCHPLLTSLAERIKAFLVEWPGQPVLQQVCAFSSIENKNL